MLKNTNAMGIGIICELYRDGIIIDKFDTDNNIIYLSVPKTSYVYEMGNANNAEDFVKNIKTLFASFLNDIKIKYKTRDIYWTNEMGNKSLEENKEKIISMFYN